MITVAEALEKAKTIGGKDGLNCIAGLVETAESSSEGPLAGVPVLVKDNIDVAGFPTTAGSLAMEDNMAETDAHIINNLRKNGAVIIGKTNMTELANFVSAQMPCGYSSRGGQVIHAVRPDLDPLGSSTGSAVAVAAGIVPMAVGTDTCHSITGCATGNGVCGLKPPAGALSKEGILPLSKTLDSAGPMAMNMTDTLKLYSAMRDEPLPEIKKIEPEKLKIAVNIANAESNFSSAKIFLEYLFGIFKENGVKTGEVDQPPALQISTLMKWDFRSSIEGYLKTRPTKIKTLKELVDYYEANPDSMMKYGDGLLRSALDETTDKNEYRTVLEEREKAIMDVTDEISGYDAVLMTAPTSVMHFCGLPTVTVAFDKKDKNGVRETVILYGADELRLYAAALTIEDLVNSAES